MFLPYKCKTHIAKRLLLKLQLLTEVVLAVQEQLILQQIKIKLQIDMILRIKPIKDSNCHLNTNN